LLLHKHRIRSFEIIQTYLQGTLSQHCGSRSYFDILFGPSQLTIVREPYYNQQRPIPRSRISSATSRFKMFFPTSTALLATTLLLSTTTSAAPTRTHCSRRRHTTSRHFLSIGCTLVPRRIITKHTHPGLVFKSRPPARALPTHGPGSVRLVRLKTRRRQQQQRPRQVRSAIKKRSGAKTDRKAAPAHSMSLGKRSVHGVQRLVCDAVGAADCGRGRDSRVHG
jgi:hypothetical protein